MPLGKVSCILGMLGKGAVGGGAETVKCELLPEFGGDEPVGTVEADCGPAACTGGTADTDGGEYRPSAEEAPDATQYVA